MKSLCNLLFLILFVAPSFAGGKVIIANTDFSASDHRSAVRLVNAQQILGTDPAGSEIVTALQTMASDRRAGISLERSDADDACSVFADCYSFADLLCGIAGVEPSSVSLDADRGRCVGICKRSVGGIQLHMEIYQCTAD